MNENNENLDIKDASKDIKEAFSRAFFSGPSDETRNICVLNADYSYYYALDIDQESRDDTRNGALRSPMSIYYYVLNIDKTAQASVKRVLCNNAQYLFWYIQNIEERVFLDLYHYYINSLFYTKLYNIIIFSMYYPSYSYSSNQINIKIYYPINLFRAEVI